jgi:hypothetical protein
MFKKIAAAAVLAGALAFSAVAPATLSAGSVSDAPVVSAGTGIWPDPMSKQVKDKKSSDTTYTTNSTGIWPDPM